MGGTGLCECGCGGHTRLAPQNNTKRGWKVGEPIRFLPGHNQRGKRSGSHHLDANGYIRVSVLSSPTNIYEHIVVAEKALGRKLPIKAQVHHVDEVRSNNRNNNLVICEDCAYHRLLHLRKEALEQCGNPNYRRCGFCCKFDDPGNLMPRKGQGSGQHHKCWAKYKRKRRNKHGRN